MKLVPQIREKRMEAHLTQIELSEITGISQAQLSEYERGKNFPSTPILFLIAKGIGCLVDNLYLVTDE